MQRAATKSDTSGHYLTKIANLWQAYNRQNITFYKIKSQNLPGISGMDNRGLLTHVAEKLHADKHTML